MHRARQECAVGSGAWATVRVARNDERAVGVCSAPRLVDATTIVILYGQRTLSPVPLYTAKTSGLQAATSKLGGISSAHTKRRIRRHVHTVPLRSYSQ